MTAASGGTGTKLTYGIASNTTGTAPADGAYSFTNQKTRLRQQPLQGFLPILPDSLILLPSKMKMDVLLKRMVLQPLLTGPGTDLAVGGFIRDNPSAIVRVDGSIQLSGGGVTGGHPSGYYLIVG